MFWLNWREKCQFSACTQLWVNFICAVLNHKLLLEVVSIFVGTGSVLHSACDREFCSAALRQKKLFNEKKRPFQWNADFLRTYLRYFADIQAVIFIKIPKGL